MCHSVRPGEGILLLLLICVAALYTLSPGTLPTSLQTLRPALQGLKSQATLGPVPPIPPRLEPQPVTTVSLCHLQCGTPQVNWALPKGRGHLLRTCPMPAPFQPHSHHSLSAGLPGPPITPTYQEETQTMEVSRSYHVFNSCLFSICQAPPYPGYWHCLTHPAPARLSDELGENHAHFTDKGMETLRPQTTESGRRTELLFPALTLSLPQGLCRGRSVSRNPAWAKVLQGEAGMLGHTHVSWLSHGQAE